MFRLIFLAFFAFLPGCTQIIDTYHSSDYIEINDYDTRLKMSYLSRGIQSSYDQDALAIKLQGSELTQNWINNKRTSLLPVLAQASTDIAVQQIGSSLGSTIGTSMMGAGFVLNSFMNGSFDYVGQAFLPEKFQGEKLETAEQAHAALIRFTEQKVRLLAERIGWSFECSYGCDGPTQSYVLRRGNGKPLSDRYLYTTENVMVFAHIKPLLKVAPDDVINALLDFPVKWKTAPGFTYIIEFYSDPIFNKGNQLVLKFQDDLNSLVGLSRGHYFKKNRAGHDFLRAFHSTPYTFFADKFSRALYYDGVEYSFTVLPAAIRVNKFVSEEIYLTN